MSNYRGKIVYAYTNELSLDLSKCLYIGMQKKRPKGRFERMKEHASDADPQAEKFREIKYVMLAEIDDMNDVNYIESVLIRKYSPEMNTRENPEEYESVSRYDEDTEREVEQNLNWFITDNTYEKPFSLDWFFATANEKLRDYYHPGLTEDEFKNIPLDDLLTMFREHGRIRTGFDRYYGEGERTRVYEYKKNELGKESIAFTRERETNYPWKSYEERTVLIEPVKKYNEIFDVTEVFEPETLGGLISQSRSKKWFLENGKTYSTDGIKLTEKEMESLDVRIDEAGYFVNIGAKYDEYGIDMEAVNKEISFWKSEILNGIFCLAAEEFSNVVPEFANEISLKTITGRTLGILTQDYDLPLEAVEQVAALKNAVAVLHYCGRQLSPWVSARKVATLAEEIDRHCITELEGLSDFCNSLDEETRHKYGFVSYEDISLCKCACYEYEKLMNGEDLSYTSHMIIEKARGNIRLCEAGII